MEEKEKTISVFNEGVAQIQRLDKIWQDSRIRREAGSLELCIWVLHSAEIELSDDIFLLDDEQEEGEYDKKLQKINESIDGLKKTDSNYFPKLYNLLIKKEKFLKRIQRLAGKGGKRKSLDEDDMD